MKAIKNTFVFPLALLAALILPACANSPASGASGSSNADSVSSPSSQTYTLKFAHEMAEGTPEAIAADKFAANVHERTNGAVTIQVFPRGQLGDPATAIESATLGNIDIVSCASGNFARFDKIFNIDTIPYLYASGEDFTRILSESGALDKQISVLQDNGFVMLNESRNCFRGPYRVLVSTKPINAVEDIKGIRLRAFENTNYMTAYGVLGANAIVLPWSDVYMSLQQGVVECAACAIGSLKAEGFTEVAPYVANVNEYLSSIIMVGTNQSFGKLPAEYVQIIKECADQYGTDVNSATEESLESQLEEMAADGAIFVTVDTAPAREALKDFYYSLEENGTLPAGTVDVALGS